MSSTDRAETLRALTVRAVQSRESGNIGNVEHRNTSRDSADRPQYQKRRVLAIHTTTPETTGTPQDPIITRSGPRVEKGLFRLFFLDSSGPPFYRKSSRYRTYVPFLQAVGLEMLQHAAAVWKSRQPVGSSPPLCFVRSPRATRASRATIVFIE